MKYHKADEFPRHKTSVCGISSTPNNWVLDETSFLDNIRMNKKDVCKKCIILNKGETK